MKWSSISLIVCVLIQGCYEPSELDYQSVCATNDADCLAQDNDGDGVKNGEDDFPFDGRCSVLDDENCSACGEGCESPLVCIKAERSCGEGEPMAGSPMAGTPMAGIIVDVCEPSGADNQCDDLDNDCDGSVDESYQSETTSCGVGECLRSGSTSCINGDVIDSCSPGVGVTDNQCDGLDNDCDGSIDESYQSETTSCGVGECTRSGSTSCINGDVIDSCSPGVGTADNQCDGLDNDCDGSVDEDECISTCTTNCPDLDFVNIPSGAFEMGSTAYSNEQPIHTVTVPRFEITRTEVTVAQYRACVDAGACSLPNTNYSACTWSNNSGTKENHPINCVDWGQARTFAKWIGSDVDLPTEAEWEYAARGGQDYLYSGSDTASEVGWYSSNSGDSTHPVGTLSANGFGLYDMSGNVWEWTLDKYHSSYTGAPSDGSVWGDLPICNQMCDTGSAGRVFRGGSWVNFAVNLRVAYRFYYSPGNRNVNLGFRLRRTIP